MKTQIWLHIIDMVDEYAIILLTDADIHRVDIDKNTLSDRMYSDLHMNHDSPECTSATIEAAEFALDWIGIEYDKVTVEHGSKLNNIYIWNE